MSEEGVTGGDAGGVEGGVGDAGAAAPVVENTPWYGDQMDADTVGYIQKKGWDGEDGAVKAFESARQAEKMISQIKGNPDQLIKMPSDWENATEVAEFRSKMGIPESAEAYDFGLPEDAQVNQDFVDWFRGAAHKNNISGDAAKNILGEYMEMEAQATEAYEAKAEEDWQYESDQGLAQFKKEVGLAYDDMVNAGKLAARTFPELGENMTEIERAIGTEKMMRLFSSIGKGLGEHSALGQDQGGNSFAKTPEQAIHEINELRMDSNFMNSYTDANSPGHKAALNKWTRLHQEAYPD